MTGRLAPRYTLPDQCHVRVILGRDGRWYRLCLTCDADALRGRGRHGYAREYDAAQSARAHARDMAANRRLYARRMARAGATYRAARAGDFCALGRAFMEDPHWTPGSHSLPDEQQRMMADFMARYEKYAAHD